MAKRNEALERQLVDLEKLTIAELAEKYRLLFGRDTRTRNRPYLVRKISWRLQELAEGGLSERARAHLADLVANAPLRHVAPRGARGKDVEEERRERLRPKSGTVLRREHNGKEYTVTVHDADFEYRGKRYASLSRIANEITGSHWNGWRFFNLPTRKSDGAAQ